MQIIRLDRDRKLEFDTDAFLQLEEALGEPIFPIMADEKKAASLKVIILMVWAGLLKHESLTQDEVKKLFPLHRLTEILLKTKQEITDAITPKEGTYAKKKKKKEQDLKASGSGTTQ